MVGNICVSSGRSIIYSSKQIAQQRQSNYFYNFSLFPVIILCKFYLCANKWYVYYGSLWLHQKHFTLRHIHMLTLSAKKGASFSWGISLLFFTVEYVELCANNYGEGVARIPDTEVRLNQHLAEASDFSAREKRRKLNLNTKHGKRSVTQNDESETEG